MNRLLIAFASAAALAACVTPLRAAGVTLEGEKGYVKFGGRIQLQYHYADDSKADDSTDELIFRRFRPYIEGSVHDDWLGKFQWDMGKGRAELKEAYFQYKGWDYAAITLGNANFPFSRELLTSSKYQQLVERTFVGDHNYGTPDRQAGVHLTGGLMDDMLTWGVSGCMGAQDPDNKKLDFEPAISLEKGDDWSDGPMIGARIDVHPFGKLGYSQGDFDRDLKATIGAAAFMWQNDEDNLDAERSKKDVDNVMGFEVSAAVRGFGLSIDAQYNRFESELVEGAIDGGLYKDGKTVLQNYSVEGGYMVWPKTVELVAGYQSQNADGYAESWNRASVGANWYVKKHDIKYQLTYQMGRNKDGEDGHDVDEVFVQAQYVF